MRVLQTIHLSDFQKKVLVTIKAAPTPQVAFEEMQKQPAEERNNIIGARNTLEKLGMIAVGDHMIQVTPQGEEVMQDEYLIDEIGELTDEAQKYLQDASGNQEASQQSTPQNQMGMGNEPGIEEPNPFESLELFRFIHDQSKFVKD